MFKTIKKLINKIFNRKVIVAKKPLPTNFKYILEPNVDESPMTLPCEMLSAHIEKRIATAGDKPSKSAIKIDRVKIGIPTNHDDLIGHAVESEIKKIEQRKATKEEIKKLTRYAEGVIKDIKTKHVKPAKNVDVR